MAEPQLRLSEVVAALSHALDLTEGQPRGHAVRTCLIGMRLGEEIGLDAAERSALFYALLLKDAGCSSNASRLHTLFRTDDRVTKRAMKLVDFSKLSHAATFALRTAGRGRGLTARTASTLTLAAAGPSAGRELVALRCERGAEIARMIGFHEQTAAAIRALDEHWDGRGYPDGLRGAEIPMLARIACLGQTLEVFVAERGLEAGLAMVRRRRGRWFDPVLVDLVLDLAGDQGFWSSLRDADVTAVEPPERAIAADERQIDRVAEAFARVIDAKSPYTHRHSERVAEIAVAIALQLGLDDERVVRLRRAGLLHDIGKLAVPNTILDKPGPLSDAERAMIAEHPRHGEEILERVQVFGEIATLAGAHHERLDGTGYPTGRRGSDLTLSMRILAVADVFEALTAARPYRNRLSDTDALAIIGAEAGTTLCAIATAALAQVIDRTAREEDAATTRRLLAS